MKTKCAILMDKNRVEVKDIELPELEQGQVLVKIHYAGLCGTQIGEIRGNRGVDKYLPHLLGHEASGKVIDVGQFVGKIKIGDKVICSWMKSSGEDGGSKKYEGKYNAGPITTFQEYSIISEDRLIKVPQSVDMVRAALFGCMIPTGVGSIINILSPKIDSNLAIVGCGNIGSAAILGARQFGCENITAIDIDEKKRDYCYRLGATDFKTSIDTNYDDILETTGNVGVIHQCIDSISDTGKVVIASNPNEKISINPIDLSKGKIYGSWGGFWSKDNCRMHEFVQEHLNKLDLDNLNIEFYSLDDINDAIDAFDNVIGKILIKMI